MNSNQTVSHGPTKLSQAVSEAVEVLKKGGVIAYPTESCYGLGCDPMNEAAVRRILDVKNRSEAQGVILVASDTEQIKQYADLNAAPLLATILDSWPGPNTWLLAKRNTVPKWICGEHDTIAMRVTAHQISREICQLYGSAIVSTSANRHGEQAIASFDELSAEMGSEIDYIVDGNTDGASMPSLIRDAVSGAQLR